jgi:type VI secretion system VgrG family protein
MAHTEFRFNSDSGESFTVVSFTATEGISQLYRYEIELKAPLARAIEIEDILDDPATFIAIENSIEYPVHGILASLDEIKTVGNYVYYKAVLVPQLWKLSIYKTNEIYTTEKTVDIIIQTVLENAGLTSGTDFDLGLLNTANFLQRDYVCQFGESDFDFISRLMENEGIFYYFDHSGTSEKIVFINDDNYVAVDEPDMIYETGSTSTNQHRHISAWACRIQRLPASVSVRDYNSSQPSHDIANTLSVDALGTGTDYHYGGHILDADEATEIAEIRAQQMKSNKTRYYGESSVCRLQAGYSFALDLHPNSKYNGLEYLLLEVTHEGSQLDMSDSAGSSSNQPTYQNSFVAIESTIQFRPPLRTPKPRFYGTMTAFIHAETGTTRPEVNEFGEYRVHLPFDRADGTKLSTDPDRKASTWMRMAQPYVGQDQGMYFPLTGGTEVLLTFINGDPDQPIISAAIPNASQPSLMEENPEWASSVTNKITQTISGNTHTISTNSARVASLEEPPPQPIPTNANAHFINDGKVLAKGMLPPWTDIPLTQAEIDDATPAYYESLIKYKFYDEKFEARDMVTADLQLVSTDRSAGDNYVYANARTFAYPQHERVYFIGTFHEDFHVKDDFMDKTKSHTGQIERFSFPPPGVNHTAENTPWNSTDDAINPNGIRGVSEDKRWGDQMFYAWGRSFNWSAGAELGGSDAGGAFGQYNYGNGLTENLIMHTGGTSATLGYDDICKDQMAYDEDGWGPSPSGGMAGYLGVVAQGLGSVNNWLKEGIDKAQVRTGSREWTGERSAIEGIGDARKLYPGTTSVEKTYGGTYSYHLGFAVDIHQGHSVSKTYGDSEEMVEGDSESVVHGDSYETVIGTSNSFFMGAKSEIALSVDSEIKLALDSTIQLGGVFGFQLAAGMQVELGPMVTFGMGEIELKTAKQKAAAAELETTVASIKSAQTKIQNQQVVLQNRTTTLTNNQLELQGFVLALSEAKLRIM